jgi:chromosome segregation ATPase
MNEGDNGIGFPEPNATSPVNLEEELRIANDRLEKLYTGYNESSKLNEELQAIIEVLEKEAVNSEIEKEGIQSLLNEKDDRLRSMELDHAKANKTIEHLEPKLEKTEEMYSREKARLGRVFEVAEELDEALQTATTEMSARDDWYVQHMQLFENLSTAIQTRYEMIDSAVQAMAEFRQKQDTFKDRMEEALDAVKEQTIEENTEEEVKEETE